MSGSTGMMRMKLMLNIEQRAMEQASIQEEQAEQ